MKQRPAFVYWLDMRKYEHLRLEYDRDTLLAAVTRYLVKSYCFNIKPSYNPSYWLNRRNVDMLFNAFMGETPFSHSTLEAMTNAVAHDGSELTVRLFDGPCIIIN